MTGGWEWDEVITRVLTAEAEGALTTELGNVVMELKGWSDRGKVLPQPLCQARVIPSLIQCFLDVCWVKALF